MDQMLEEIERLKGELKDYQQAADAEAKAGDKAREQLAEHKDSVFQYGIENTKLQAERDEYDEKLEIAVEALEDIREVYYGRSAQSIENIFTKALAKIRGE